MFFFFSFVFFRRLFLACSEVVLTLTRWIFFIFIRTGLVLFVGTACKFATMIGDFSDWLGQSACPYIGV
jgi:hypothetical protein